MKRLLRTVPDLEMQGLGVHIGYEPRRIFDVGVKSSGSAVSAVEVGTTHAGRAIRADSAIFSSPQSTYRAPIGMVGYKSKMRCHSTLMYVSATSGNTILVAVR